MPENTAFSATCGARAFIFAGMILAGAGCAEHRPPDELANAVEMGERPVAMKGEATFFNGRITAVVTISRGIGRGYGPAEGKRKKHAAPSPGTPGAAGLPDVAAGDRGAAGNGQQRTGPGGPAGGVSASATPDVNISASGGARSEMPDINGMEQEEATAYIRAKIAIGSPLPPVTLHLKLQNLGAEKTSVEIDDFDSDLGNFAVQPGSLTIAAQEVGEPEPMISQLGVTSDEIPVKVTLKSGGKKETQTILVKSLGAKAAEPPR